MDIKGSCPMILPIKTKNKINKITSKIKVKTNSLNGRKKKKSSRQSSNNEAVWQMTDHLNEHDILLLSNYYNSTIYHGISLL